MGNNCCMRSDGSEWDEPYDHQWMASIQRDGGIWYRHSGQPPASGIPRARDCKFEIVQSDADILQDIGGHDITHMYVRGGYVPTLRLVAPKLTELKIEGVLPSEMKRFEYLPKLKLLCISKMDLPEDLDLDIHQLTSLERLELLNCAITDLPDNFSSLKELKILILPENDFSRRLPDVITKLTSLEQVRLWNCGLTHLPESLSSLRNLKSLNLFNNNFSKGLPEVIGELQSLDYLNIELCRLTKLPESIGNLKNLKTLQMNQNYFQKLPAAIYKLASLEKLLMHTCLVLTEVEDLILELEHLHELDCNNCESLENPPYAVCEQGWPAVKKYFEDLRKERGIEQTVVPVAVVGMTLSGKTSMIRSLQAGERKLTYRNESSPLDEATKVFNIENLILENSRVNLVDYGGHSIYHYTYQLVINEKCVPAVVVNMSEFADLSHSRSPKEATRRLCIEWLAQLYLASPRLGPPILVFTHTDKLTAGQMAQSKNELLSNAEIIRQEILEEARQCSDSIAAPIIHLSNEHLPLFHSDDVVEFNDTLHATESIEHMKERIDKRSKDFFQVIPRLWELVREYIENHKNNPYVSLPDIKRKFSGENPNVILRYLHNIGKILWFEKFEGLSGFIFHRIAVITDLITLLFHHTTDALWKQRIANFTHLRYKGRVIGPHEFGALVNQFCTTGEIDEALLNHLFKDKSEVPVEVAVQLLQCFLIVHGPIKRGSRSAYILPSFAKGFVNSSWKTDGYLQLRLEIALSGLPLPHYVFQLVTVEVLNRTDSSDTIVKVARNGATIRHGECATHVVHDSISKVIILQLSTTVKKIGESWSSLLVIADAVLSLISRVWKGCHAEKLVYCTHCLFLGDPTPKIHVNPRWFESPKQEQFNRQRIGSGRELLVCPRSAPDSEDPKPTVPKALVRPCLHLTKAEIRYLERYLQDLQSSNSLRSQDVIHEEVKPTISQSHHGEDSDISDVEEEGYCEGSKPDKADMMMRVRDTKLPTVKLLYDNTEKVYKMSDKTRGKVLIFNIKSFSDNKDTREGSEVDYRNISRLFNDLRFDIVKSEKELTDLTKQEMCLQIKEETQKIEHSNFGMFVLVIMSHGKEGDVILDHHKKPVRLIDLYDLLSPHNFPAMSGKPKLVIVQACSGARPDPGDSKEVLTRPVSAASASTDDRSTQCRPPSVSGAEGLPATAPASDESSPITFRVAKRPHEYKTPTVFNADDFFIMKASSESYLATRSENVGSWFIRALVATFYKHSCHRDVESLFKIIQNRVRQDTLEFDDKLLYITADA